MFLKTGRHRFRRDVRHRLQNFEIAVQIHSRPDLVIDRERADDLLHMNHRDTDERDIFRIFPGLGLAEKFMILGDVRNDAGKPRGRHLSRDPFADLVGPPLHLLFRQSVRSLDEQRVSMHQSERPAQKPHLPVKNVQNGLQKRWNVPFMDNCFADAVQNGNFQIVFSAACHDNSFV